MVSFRENSLFHISENGLFSQNGLFLGPFQNGLSFTTGPRIPRSVRKQGLRFQVYYMAIKLYFLTFYPEELQNQPHPNILGPLVSTLGTLFLRPLHRREQRGGGGAQGRSDALGEVRPARLLPLEATPAQRLARACLESASGTTERGPCAVRQRAERDTARTARPGVLRPASCGAAKSHLAKLGADDELVLVESLPHDAHPRPLIIHGGAHGSAPARGAAQLLRQRERDVGLVTLVTSMVATPAHSLACAQRLAALLCSSQDTT